MTEHCYLYVNQWPVTGDERKKRGWKRDGIAAGAHQALASGAVVYHELHTAEGVDISHIGRPTWEFRQAFLAFLNKLSADGWRVVQYVSYSTDQGSWPFGSWLLVREVTTSS